MTYYDIKTYYNIIYKMPKVQTDYSNTIIYKLCCKDPNITDIYIGHTTNFIQRKKHHKILTNNLNCNRYVYNFIRNHGGWDNWTMIQIENICCKDKREAESNEQYWIEKNAAKLNSVNPFTLHKEEPQLYKQLWYEEKKDYILEKAKEHYEENKETILEKAKHYAEEHKEQIADYQKEYKENNKEKISEQKKIYREEHKEEAAKAQKEWREANKEILKAKKGEIVECECGHHYTFGNKHRHLQSKLHVLYQTQLCQTEEEKQILEENNTKLEEEKINKQKEQQKSYRETHKEKIQEYKKQNYEIHKEDILEKNKQYKEEHKEKIIQQQKIYIEENKEKIQNYKNDWYQKNKEKILQKQKEIIICDCGAEIRKSGKAEHDRSKKHQDYIQMLIN